MKIDAKTTAIVLIEYQNDFTSSGGAFHNAVASVMGETNMLANTVNAIRSARRHGAVIVHVPIAFADGYGEIAARPYGILKSIVDARAFIKGSWGAAICEGIAPEPGDILVEGKRGLDAFASTNLDFVLRQREIKVVALAGFLSNCCVESTMRSAYERGFTVITLTDCVAATSFEAQANALRFDFPMFSLPMTSPAFAAALAQ